MKTRSLRKKEEERGGEEVDSLLSQLAESKSDPITALSIMKLLAGKTLVKSAEPIINSISVNKRFYKGDASLLSEI
jgi:hypothetical protein